MKNVSEQKQKSSWQDFDESSWFNTWCQMIINFLSRLFVSLFVCFFFCLFAILPGGVPGHHPKMINYLGGLGRWCSATSPPILPLYNKLLLLLPVVVGGSLPPILPLSPAVRRPSITLFYPRAIPFSYTPLYKQAIGVCELGKGSKTRVTEFVR